MSAYEILRLVLGPFGRPIGVLAARLRAQRTTRQFGSIGPDVVFGGDVRVDGGARITVGPGCRVMHGVTLWATPRGSISIGSGTYLGDYTFVVSDAGIDIGADVLIAPFCYLQDSDHGFASVDQPMRDQPSVASRIVIEDDVWIGTHSVITRGVRIGHGAVVGANSVVTHDVEPFAVVAGSPARMIRSRLDPS